MKKFAAFILAAFAVVLASCSVEKTPEQKVAALLTARFDSLALDCKVVSVALKDTIKSNVSSDPVYKELYEKWDALLYSGISFSDPEYIEAREALLEYKAAFVGEPVALTYTCIVECEEILLKSMIESGAFAVNLEHTKILDLE